MRTGSAKVVGAEIMQGWAGTVRSSKLCATFRRKPQSFKWGSDCM